LSNGRYRFFNQITGYNRNVSLDRRHWISGAVSAACGSAAIWGTGCGRQVAELAGFAFVANHDGNALAVVDLNAFAVSRYIPLGASPTQVVFHPVTEQVLALTPSSNQLHIIDKKQLAVARKINVPAGTKQLYFSPDPEMSALFLIAPQSRQVWKMSLKTMALQYKVDLPESVDFFDVANWTGWAMAGNRASGKLTVFNVSDGGIKGQFSTGASASAMLFRSDGRQIWAAHADRKQVAGFQAFDGKTVVRLPVALTPDSLFNSPDGGSIFVTGPDRDAIVVVEPYPAQVATTLFAGPRPGAMAAARGLPYLFIASRTANQVSVFDMELRKVIAVTTVGSKPNFIKVTRDQQYALVLNEDSGDMAVLRTVNLRAQRQKTAALLTMIPIGSRPVSADVSWA
jgi:DNA-binding beta-propeller fold protein YncE